MRVHTVHCLAPVTHPATLCEAQSDMQLEAWSVDNASVKKIWGLWFGWVFDL